MCLGLLSGKYSKKVDEDDNSDAQLGIAPYAFKALIGKGHPEFSTKKQQDTQEFFLHVVNFLEKHSRTEVNPATCFKFQVEDKLQCNESKVSSSYSKCVCYNSSIYFYT
jgi:ubiquitin carboxyl-terminal hydrolase 5/13